MSDKVENTEAEKLRNAITKLHENYKQQAQTAISISRDHAVKVAKLINDESDKGIKERNNEYFSYIRWEQRADLLEAFANEIKYIINSV